VRTERAETITAALPPTLHLDTVEVNGQPLRVGRWPGRTGGPPLLIFNGIGANIELVAPFVAALDGVEAVTFDIPGTGGSPLPALPYRFSTLARLAERLLDALGYDGAVDVLGVSWGGALAQQFAHQYGDRCRRLILAATSPGALMVPGRPSALLKLLSPRRYRDREYLQEIGPALYGGAYRRDPGLLQMHSEQIRSPGGLGYAYQLFAAWGWTSALWLRALRQPTLVMHGNDDPIVPLVNAKLLATLIRDARLHVVDDGHLFIVTRAMEVAPVVRAFLAGERG
jgi:poly(3-hydroxyalkanoate) depolymerase